MARGNYLSQDRADISYAVKELTRRMSSPTEDDMVALRRLVKYLIGRPRLVNVFPYRHEPQYLQCWVDADWAGFVRTRRSTSGGGIKLGTHTIKIWTGTQASIALSSGESEYYALVKGISQCLGIQSLLKDFGRDIKIRVFTDSTAAQGIAQRVGLGKTRHVSVHSL